MASFTLTDFLLQLRIVATILCEKNESQKNQKNGLIILFSFLLNFLLLEMQKHEGKDADPGHHAEGACVVGVGRNYEPLILIVAKRNNRNLGLKNYYIFKFFYFIFNQPVWSHKL